MFHPHRALIEQLKAKGAFYQTVNKRNERVWTAYATKEPFYTLAAKHPEARDALACIAVATIYDPNMLETMVALDTTVENIYGAGGNIPKDALYTHLLRAYADAPAELAECGLDIQRMIRNFATVFHGLQTRLAGRESEFASPFIALFRDPPEAVTVHNDYLHAHKLHTGILAYRFYLDTEDERRRMLQALADSVDHFVARLRIASYVPLSSDDVEQLITRAPRTLPMLPLVHKLNDTLTTRWVSASTRHFLDALVDGRGAFGELDRDDQWVSRTLRPAVARELDRLFDARDFAPESVDAVIQSALEAMGLDQYTNDWVRPVLANGSKNLLRNLVAAYANRFPDSARTLVRRVAQYATTPATLDKFAELIAGSTPTEHHEVETKIPPVVREEARIATIRNYPQLRGEITAHRGRVALRLITAFLGIPTEIAIEPLDPLRRWNDSVRRWEHASRHLLEPDIFLRRHYQSDFASWYDTARRQTIEKRLCDS